VERYQDANDPVEAERLRREISQELFGLMPRILSAVCAG